MGEFGPLVTLSHRDRPGWRFLWRNWSMWRSSLALRDGKWWRAPLAQHFGQQKLRLNTLLFFLDLGYRTFSGVTLSFLHPRPTSLGLGMLAIC